MSFGRDRIFISNTKTDSAVHWMTFFVFYKYAVEERVTK